MLSPKVHRTILEAVFALAATLLAVGLGGVLAWLL